MLYAIYMLLQSSKRLFTVMEYRTKLVVLSGDLVKHKNQHIATRFARLILHSRFAMCTKIPQSISDIYSNIVINIIQTVANTLRRYWQHWY